MSLSRYQIFRILAFFSGLGFLLFSFFVINGTFLPFDRYIDQTLLLSKGSPNYLISVVLAYLFIPLAGILAFLILKYVAGKKRFEVIMILASTSGFVASELILKPICRIQCPPTFYSNILSGEGLFNSKILQKLALEETCYPSGHTTAYVVFFGYLAFLSLRLTKGVRKFILLTFLTAVIILIGFSRIYLHVHWVSDVIGGYLLGFSLLLFLLSLRKQR